MVTNSIAQEHLEENFEHHCKFEERSLTLGIGLPYSSEVNSIGFNLRMYYNLGEKICFGPEYSYFKTGDYEVVDFDLVGNYTVETDLHSPEEIEESFAVIFGFGAHRNFKSVTIFAEYSRVELGIDDQFVTTGIMFNFR